MNPSARIARGLLAFLALTLAASIAAAFEGQVIMPDGTPVVGAEVSVLGRNVTQITSSSGTFTWEPTPPPPFEVLVVLPGGRYMRPFLVSSIPSTGPVLIRVEPI